LFEGVGTVLHETLHASSHSNYKYEQKNPAGRNTFFRRPFAAMEEATTEYLAFANRRRFAESMGMKVLTPPSQLDVPYFRKPAAEYGREVTVHREVKLTDDFSMPEIKDFTRLAPRSSAYPDCVRRFAIAAAAAEDADTPEAAHAAAQSWAATIKTTRGNMRYARMADRFAHKAFKGKRDHPLFELARNNIAFELKRYFADLRPVEGLRIAIEEGLRQTQAGYDLHAEGDLGATTSGEL
jgi:hypothetical protein